MWGLTECFDKFEDHIEHMIKLLEEVSYINSMPNKVLHNLSLTFERIPFLDRKFSDKGLYLNLCVCNLPCILLVYSVFKIS